jgi:hypothetical protein
MEGTEKFVTNGVQFPGNKMSKAITWLIFLHPYIIDKYISYGDVACVRRNATYAALAECCALEFIPEEQKFKKAFKF